MSDSVELRQHQIRCAILEILGKNLQMTARDLAFELSVRDIWITKHELVPLIHQDEHLRRRVEIEYRCKGGWQRLLFRLKSGPWNGTQS